MVTTYFLNCIMGNVFKTKTSPALPTSFYMGLSTSTPAVGGTGVSEPSGKGYARVKVSSLTAPANGVITNTADVEFNESTGDWGTITHFVIYDAATGGNLLLYEALKTPRVVQSETQARFKANTLSITLKNAS